MPNNKTSAYIEAEKDLETTVVKVFDEDMTFYRDTKGHIFSNKPEAVYSQTKINRYENGINELRDILKDRLINLNDEDLLFVTENIGKIQNLPMRMLVSPYNIIFKVFNDSDSKAIIDKIDELGIFPLPFKKYFDYTYPEDKSYDVIFINTAEYKMTTLSLLKDISYKYIVAYNNVYYRLNSQHYKDHPHPSDDN